MTAGCQASVYNAVTMAPSMPSADKLVLAAFSLAALALAQPPAKSAASSYLRDIRPLLQRHCQACHQPAVKQADLDLTSYDTFKAGGRKGAPFQPGAPGKSLILAHLKGDAQPRMPMALPPLADDQIDLFRRWIAAGARDDTPVEVRENAPVGTATVYRLPPVITALAYSPDGRWLAVSGHREVLLHTSDGASMEARLVGLSDRIQSIVFSPDGQTLVAAGGTPARFGEVQFWNVAARKLERSATLTSDTVFGAGLSPDGARVVVGCADNTVRVVDAAQAKEVLKIAHHENWVLGAVFGIDGKRIVSVGRDRAAKLTDAASGAFIENVNLLRGELSAIARHPRRDFVLIGSEERVPYLYMMDRPRAMKIADDTTLVRKFEKQAGPIFAVAFSPDASRIAVAGAFPEVVIYNTETGGRVASCRGHQAGVYTVAFHPNGSQLAAAGFDGRVRLYRTATGELAREFVPVPLEAQLVTERRP